MTRYVIITPVRDEEKHIEATIESVRRQTILPLEWVIVDDGSTDRTGEILDRVAAQLPWIACHTPNEQRFPEVRRRCDGSVLRRVQHTPDDSDWDFIVKLDGDLSFAPEYFEKCFEYFRRDPELGIGGGEIHHNIVWKAETRRKSAVPRARGHEDLQESLLGSDWRTLAGAGMGHDR